MIEENKSHRLVIFDLETTGLDKDKDQIIQFSGIKIKNNKVVDTLNLKICSNFWVYAKKSVLLQPKLV